MPPVVHQPLLNEATLQGTQVILQHLPAAYSPELHEVIRQGVRHSILHYCAGLETLERQLHPLEYAGKGRT